MARNPISIRLNEVQHRELVSLGGTDNASAVMQDALSRMARLKVDSVPLYARLVSDPRVEEVIERTVSAACDELSELFPKGRGIEYKGISSNFQGLLGDHIRAMLTGVEHANKSWKTELNALLATEDAFGRLPRGLSFERDVGFTVVKLAKRHGQKDLFLNTERDYCELRALDAGMLFTTPGDCVKGVLEWMEQRDMSPRNEDVRLCAIRIPSAGPLVVLAVAGVGAESPMNGEAFRARTLTAIIS